MYAENILNVIDLVPVEGISIRGLCRKSKVHRSTIRSYIDLVIEIQNRPKISKVQKGFRTLIAKI